MCKQTATNNDARSRGTYQGMNWIRQDKRLAIYLRDGLACVYCGDGVEDGAQLSLDHVTPHSCGGSNSERNLVTCCSRCNSRRGARPVEDFAAAAAVYNGREGCTAESILADVAEFTARPLKAYRQQARELIAQRGSAAKAVASM